MFILLSLNSSIDILYTLCVKINVRHFTVEYLVKDQPILIFSNIQIQSKLCIIEYLRIFRFVWKVKL